MPDEDAVGHDGARLAFLPLFTSPLSAIVKVLPRHRLQSGLQAGGGHQPGKAGPRVRPAPPSPASTQAWGGQPSTSSRKTANSTHLRDCVPGSAAAIPTAPVSSRMYRRGSGSGSAISVRWFVCLLRWHSYQAMMKDELGDEWLRPVQPPQPLC